MTVGGLIHFDDFIGPILIIGHFGIQVKDILYILLCVLYHEVGLPAPGPGGTDENNRFAEIECFQLLFQVANGDIDRRFESPC